MSWGNASTFDSQIEGWGQSAPPAPSGAAPSGADPISAVSDLANVGARIGELISANKFQNQMLREQKLQTRNAKISARRQAKFARADAARADRLQSRLAALKAVTGARDNKTIVASVGVIVLAGLFLLATRSPKPKPTNGSTKR